MKCLQRIFCCKKKKNVKEVYVLQLEQQKYYVGESFNVNKRIQSHINNGGSGWTRKYKVICSEKTITNPQDTLWELSETLEQMNIHGIDNVRGSMFTKPFNLTKQEKIMAAQLYCEKYNLCRKCGEPGHFINQCNNHTVAPWVNKFGGLLNDDNNNNITDRICITCNSNINRLPNYCKYCHTCYKLSKT